jgi:hypothetical protein
MGKYDLDKLQTPHERESNVRSQISVRLIARYHRVDDNPYPFPNDEDESNRLNRLHFLMKELSGGNVLAPIIPEPSRILDVGTGSGCLHRNRMTESRCLGL